MKERKLIERNRTETSVIDRASRIHSDQRENMPGHRIDGRLCLPTAGTQRDNFVGRIDSSNPLDEHGQPL